MAEINGEFPKCIETVEKEGKGKGANKSKKLKKRLQKAKHKLSFQKKLNKERIKRCKAEAELKFTMLLLQNHGSLPESFYSLHKRK